MASLLRRFSRIMHVGVVHQIAIHFESLIVDVDATRDSPIAMSLVRSDNIQLEVTRNGKTYLVVDGGELSHGQLNFSPSAHFSARLTLFESVQGNFQPKTMTLTLRDASGLHGKSNNKKKMFTSVGQIEVSDPLLQFIACCILHCTVPPQTESCIYLYV